MWSLFNLKKYIIILLSIFCILFVYIEPTIQLIGKDTTTVEYGNTYDEEGYYIYYSLKDIKRKIKVENNINYNILGTYQITYQFQYQKKTFKKNRIIKIIDNKKPDIKLNGNSNISICPGHSYEEEGYQAIDNYDGDITSKVKITQSANKKNYEVKDSSNNMTIVSRTIEYTDNEKPSLKLSGNDNVMIYVGDKYNEEGATASDNCDGDITNNIVIDGTVDTNRVGTYEIHYKVTDFSNQSSEITRTVQVKNKPDNTGKVIYLTFDDGPSFSITPKLLQILKEENVKATFFVINHSDALNYLIKQEYDEGHTVGIHSFSHKYKNIYSSVNAYFNDLNLMSDKVYNITGVRSKIIRFPGGSSNTISKFNPGIMSVLASEVAKSGYTYFDWNVGSNDAGGVSSSNEVYQNVINGLYSYNNVVLMHDYENNYYTLNALRDIIRYGKENGYTFKNITESTPQIKHRIAN